MPVYFGDKIRAARKAAGLTQKQLAEKINVTNTSISNWEKNLSRPDPDDIEHLCWILGVEPNYLFSIDPLPKQNKPNISDEDIKFALFGGSGEITDAMYDEVKEFAAFVKQREKNKK